MNIRKTTFTAAAIGIMLGVTLSCSKKSSGGGDVKPDDKPKDTIDLTPSPVGDVVGKVVVGYQGWFAAIGDGSPIDRYWHWAQTWEEQPSPTNTAIKSWPDVRDYTKTFPTKYANLNNGQPANVFSSFSDQTIDMQFKWMHDYGIDDAANHPRRDHIQRVIG